MNNLSLLQPFLLQAAVMTVTATFAFGAIALLFALAVAMRTHGRKSR